ncbi:DnaA N-terminal domain-containing protein [Humitalea sp. 24SJ18S-53]|uniref:DnaA N-terminal domain-containing protein n=1 Tax=Humitalea sp. 24SJ18S-53 TaxID=3422307 RepID=UPI003D666FE7
MTRQPNLFGRSALPPRLATDFEAFWAAYPKRIPNPRAMAEAAFGRTVQGGAAPSDLVAAATGYAAECRRQGISNDFIVHARTFLGQARWIDYLPKPKASASAATAVDPAHPLAALQPLFGAAEWRAWILPIEIASLTEGMSALLVAPSKFHRDRLRQQHAPALQAALRVRRLEIVAREEMGA